MPLPPALQQEITQHWQAFSAAAQAAGVTSPTCVIRPHCFMQYKLPALKLSFTWQHSRWCVIHMPSH